MSRLIPMSDIQQIEMCPDLKHMGEFDPDNLTAAEALKVITMALAKTRDADPLARLKAEVVMNEQFSRGFDRGIAEGKRDGYRLGYSEGFEEGRQEALDTQAKEQAEAAMIKASARARRAGQGRAP